MRVDQNSCFGLADIHTGQPPRKRERASPVGRANKGPYLRMNLLVFSMNFVYIIIPMWLALHTDCECFRCGFEAGTELCD